MDKAFHAIAEVLFVYFQRQYAPDMDERMAMELATRVTFILLGPPPDDAKALLSLPVDADLVEIKLSQIKKDPEVCRMVSVFRHIRAEVAGAVLPDTAKLDAKLQKLGILLPVEQIRLPSSHRELMRQVREFESWTMR